LTLHVRTCRFAVEAASEATKAFDAYWGGAGARRRFGDIADALKTAAGAEAGNLTRAAANDAAAKPGGGPFRVGLGHAGLTPHRRRR
jgi:hypothetical protein